MSVLLETSLGNIVIDLHVDLAQKPCLNFLKLCKVKYYNFSPIFNVQRDFTFQAGDPLFPIGNGGSSIWGLIGSGPRLFAANSNDNLKHRARGTVSMVAAHSRSSKTADESETTVFLGSQFIVTLGENLTDFDGKHIVFGRVAEGFNVLDKINEALCDEDGRPFKDIRIKHTIILEDPFDDPTGLVEPSSSPLPTEAQLSTVRIAEDEKEDEENEETKEKKRLEREASAQALTLEMVGDLPFAEIKPPENVLFVCKLNPVTTEDDLELIFSRFGKVLSVEIIRDKKTDESLQYAFIEFDQRRSCEEAYFKMQDVLIDDRRIHVDFSQGIVRNWRDRYNPSKVNIDNSSRKKEGVRLGRHFKDDVRSESHSMTFDDEDIRKKARDQNLRYYRREYDRNRNGSKMTDNHRDRYDDLYGRRYKRRDDDDDYDLIKDEKVSINRRSPSPKPKEYFDDSRSKERNRTLNRREDRRSDMRHYHSERRHGR